MDNIKKVNKDTIINNYLSLINTNHSCVVLTNKYKENSALAKNNHVFLITVTREYIEYNKQKIYFGNSNELKVYLTAGKGISLTNPSNNLLLKRTESEPEPNIIDYFFDNRADSTAYIDSDLNITHAISNVLDGGKIFGSGMYQSASFEHDIGNNTLSTVTVRLIIRNNTNIELKCDDSSGNSVTVTKDMANYSLQIGESPFTDFEDIVFSFIDDNLTGNLTFTLSSSYQNQYNYTY